MDESLKALVEERNDKNEQIEALLNSVKSEKRAMTSEEDEKFTALERDIASLNESIERIERKMENENRNIVSEEDVKTFATTIRSLAEHRSDVNMTKGAAGVVIPQTIVKKIIEQVEEISPIYSKCTRYALAGKVIIPVEVTSTTDMTVAFASEFSDLESTSNTFTSVQLEGVLYGALTKISKQLLNNTDFDLTAWVVNKMAKKIAAFVENIALNGNADNNIPGIAGDCSAGTTVTLAAANAITADELIDIQDAVAERAQANAIWVMNKATRKAIRKLKDGQNNYLLEKDFSAPYGYTILGKPVYISDNVTALGTNSKMVVVYGDMAGLALKEGAGLELEVLTERFATQHAVGVVAWGEINAKIEDKALIACAKTPAAQGG